MKNAGVPPHIAHLSSRNKAVAAAAASALSVLGNT